MTSEQINLLELWDEQSTIRDSEGIHSELTLVVLEELSHFYRGRVS